MHPGAGAPCQTEPHHDQIFRRHDGYELTFVANTVVGSVGQIDGSRLTLIEL